MIDIELYQCLDEKNKINKKVGGGVKLEGTLREASDVMNPSILVEASIDAVCGYNYAYIPAFKRYSYINNTSSFRQGLSLLQMSVDVLNTFKETVLNSNCIITRSSKTGDAIHSLPDERFPVKQSETTHSIVFDSLYTNSSDPTLGQTMILVLTGIDAPTP